MYKPFRIVAVSFVVLSLGKDNKSWPRANGN
jgi:hypothetical protein